jgi:hypothetical protein
MKIKLYQFSIMIFLISVLLGAICFLATYLEESTSYGPRTKVLPVGQHVFLISDQSVAQALEVFEGSAAYGRWVVYPKPGSRLMVTAGSIGVVRVDPAWDDDSCVHDRLISIKLKTGNQRDIIIATPRFLLRKLQNP